MTNQSFTTMSVISAQVGSVQQYYYSP